MGRECAPRRAGRRVAFFLALSLPALVFASPPPRAATPTAQAAPQAAANAPGAAPVATGADVRHDSPEVVRLGQRLRCPVCQGMAIGDSPAPMAQDMMRQVRRMWADGRDEGDIAAYFTARYGDWVLLDPPWRGAGMWVWVLPPVVLALGFVTALRTMRRRADAARSAHVHRAGTAPRVTYPPQDHASSNDALRAIREEAAR